MDKKTLKEMEGRSETDLHSLIESARVKLAKDPENKEPQETIDIILGILEERRRSTGDDGDDKVKVRAKVRTPIDHVVLEKDQEGTITKRQYRALAGRLELLKLAALVAVLAGLLFGGEAKAQQYKLTLVSTNGATPLNGGTNVVASNTTNTYTYPIPTTRNGDVAIQIAFKLTTVGTSNVVAGFDFSNDATNWFSAGALVTAGNGTTVVANGTNIDTRAFGYLRLNYVSNTNNASAVTNLQILYTVKPSRFDG
jgi:hypothetical protein